MERIAAQLVVRAVGAILPVGWFAQWRLKAASGKKITIIVARLDNDGPSNTFQKTVIDAIGTQLGEGVNVYVGRRTLPLKEGTQDVAEASAKRIAIKWLKKTNCDLLIWGRVKSNNVLSLRFTPSENFETPKNYVLTSDTLELRADFVSRLGAAIAAHTASSVRTAVETPYRMIATLKELSSRLSILTETETNNFDQSTLGSLHNSQALVSVRLYDLLGNITDLEAGIKFHHDAILHRPRSQAPDEWSNSQNNLGTALARLASVTGDAQRFKEAVELIRTSLEERSPSKSLVRWTGGQLNLAGALTGLGEQKGYETELEAAGFVYDLIVTDELKKADPNLWAAAQNNRALNLLIIADREAGHDSLLQAREALTDALETVKPEDRPLDWAAMKLNLGTVLLKSADRDQILDTYEGAAEQFKDALKIFTRSQFPRRWAVVQNNLGIALCFVAYTKRNKKMLERSVSIFRELMKVYTSSGKTLEFLRLRNNLARALIFLAELSDPSEAEPIYDEAVALLREALAEAATTSLLIYWNVKRDLGLALFGRGSLAEARETYETLCADLTPTSNPIEWVTSTIGLGRTLRALAQESGDETLLRDAIERFRTVTVTFAPNSNRARWAQAHLEIARTYLVFVEREPEPDYIDLLNEECQTVLVLFAGGIPQNIFDEIKSIHARVEELESIEKATHEGD